MDTAKEPRVASVSLMSQTLELEIRLPVPVIGIMVDCLFGPCRRKAAYEELKELFMNWIPVQDLVNIVFDYNGTRKPGCVLHRARAEPYQTGNQNTVNYALANERVLCWICKKIYVCDECELCDVCVHGLFNYINFMINEFNGDL